VPKSKEAFYWCASCGVFRVAPLARLNAAGFRVIDEIIDYDKLILIDSIETGKTEPGKLHKFTFEEFKKTLHHAQPHDISLFEVFEIIKQHGDKLPSEIEIYAVEVTDTSTLSETCAIEVEAAIPIISQKIIDEQSIFK
jgi:hydrogenase maturation protease